LGFLRGLLGALAGLAVLVAFAVGVVGWVAYQRYSAGLPDIAGLQNYQPPVMSRVYAGDGRLLAEMATERRIFVPYTAIPDIVRRAFVSAEDQNFFTHPGIDPVAIIRAGIVDITRLGEKKRPLGASTITQQVAKNMLLGNNEVSLARKIREALLALRIEHTLSKDRILELYLNEIYLGLQSYGVAAAAEAYFDKPLNQLTIAQAAFLAALPKAPNNYNPFKYPEAARDRRNWVLDRMAEDGVITHADAETAKATPIEPAEFHRPEGIQGADYFTEEVRRQLAAKFGADVTTEGGLIVRTSLNPTLQATADATLRAGLVSYDQTHGGWRGPVAHLDAAAIQPTSWPTALAAVARPPGLLRTWRLAAALQVGDAQARLGVAEPGAPARALPMLLADTRWAHPKLPDGLGPAPRRMTDVLKAGDVVMVEIAPAERAQAKTPARPERLLLRQIPGVQGALVSLDPATGRVLALSGGWSAELSQFDRATQANRQPGSSFKPFVYLTALEAGVSPSQRFLDAPFVEWVPGQGEWRPANFEQDFNGPVPLHVALEKSLNLVTVRVARLVGMSAVADTATAFHIVDAMPHVLPAALGAVETTVLRQAGGYAGIAAGGKEVVPSLIDSVQDRDGHVVWRAPGVDCTGCDNPAQPPVLVDNRKQIADPQSVFQLNLMMQGVVQRGTGVNAGKGFDRQIAGKTGTTQDFQDAWFAGFTPDLVTVVWVGYDTPASLGTNETGGNVAAPIWHDFMQVALANRPKLEFVPPEGLTIASYGSGFGTVTDAFKPGQVPGGSGQLGSGIPSAADAGAEPGAPGQPGASPAGGVDSNLPGLY
jgi:penicillin-binding protein 1A